ncbi:helix-turn-helix transcriptional regulator [Bacillus sp. BGMRC 2118]|nr:helix-turn-helix transcriptional regulator [Bacillus sp. BGMRC 2118]
MVHLNVEKIRKSKGITKTHMAKKLGLTIQGYSQITSGNVRLDVERLKVIAQIMSVDPAIFFNDELTDSVINDFESKLASY